MSTQIITDTLQSTLTPSHIVEELNKYIIGQHDAKRAVAIAMRNRWRRQQLSNELAEEITPKNILMIGPTGVGKTEISRRLAKLIDAPFIKVEATKFTEVGYVGRDVESIIRDLIETAIKIVRQKEIEMVTELAEKSAIERVLDAILSPSIEPKSEKTTATTRKNSASRKLFKTRLLKGELDGQIIEIETSSNIGVEIMAPPGMEEMTNQLQNMFQSITGERVKKCKMTIKDAMKKIKEEESLKLINEDRIRETALRITEQNGIVFIDEIDKIVRRGSDHGGPDVSREGVQRDLLPLIEGCTVSTKHGLVRTNHILFIASGAFHLAKTSDLIPELQGRLPIRVELKALTQDDFARILTEPQVSLVTQYTALLGTEGFELIFADDGIQEIAKIAYQMNESSENIGARRLFTILEWILMDVSYDADKRKGESLSINKEYINQQLKSLLKYEDLSRHIL